MEEQFEKLAGALEELRRSMLRMMLDPLFWLTYIALASLFWFVVYVLEKCGG